MSKNEKFAIETFSLTKTFSDFWGRAKVCAVKDLNLQVEYNEVFGLLGPNGSGKTTAIKMLLGLLKPTKGKSLLLGGDATSPKINSKIGFMPEESYLYQYLTARETLDFYARLFSLPSAVRKTRIEALLDMVGLKAVANRPVGTFSKGMARRIGLAQALINDPDLLILDEPTTGLDPIGTRQIKDLVIELAKRGKTVLLCSHLLADVEDVCDRISILYGGRVQAQGKVKQLLQQSQKTQITTSALNQDVAGKIELLLREQNCDFEIATPMEKLEAFFIRTVTEAQAAAQTTSGAVSTTQIGEFLTAPPTEKSIIDKLVTADVEQRQQSRDVETQKSSKVEVKDEPDKNLLGELAAGPAVTKPIEKNEPLETQITDTRQVKQDVLKDLTDPANRRQTDEDSHDA